MSTGLGHRYRETGRKGIADARAALAASRPADGPRRLAVVGADGALHAVLDADVDLALAATGTGPDCPLPYRDND